LWKVKLDRFGNGMRILTGMPEDSPKPLWSELAECETRGVPHVLVMLIETKGSAPQSAGAKMLVRADGLPLGTVGGGKVEAAAIRVAREMLSQAEGPAVELRETEWNLQRDIGMTCGGAVRFLFHARRFSSWTIAIFGAGHIVQALVPLLQTLDVMLLCIDSRPEWIEKLPPHPRTVARVLENPASALKDIPERAFVLSITQGHGTDVPVLTEAFQRGCFPFVGCIGSEVKARKLRAELETAGISRELVARLRCPLGLPLGGNEPGEIAISIAAQLLQGRDMLEEKLARL
jgi:xanthine dehydrogenase accessory factor